MDGRPFCGKEGLFTYLKAKPMAWQIRDFFVLGTKECPDFHPHGYFRLSLSINSKIASEIVLMGMGSERY